MKKTALAVAFLLCAASLMAGQGHECNMNAKGKSVEMTGRIFCKAGSGDSCERVFQASAKDATPVAICEHSKADLARFGDNADVRVKAKMIKCDEDGKDVLYIESANKI